MVVVRAMNAFYIYLHRLETDTGNECGFNDKYSLTYSSDVEWTVTHPVRKISYSASQNVMLRLMKRENKVKGYIVKHLQLSSS